MRIPTEGADVVFKVDLYGTALVLQEFSNVIARGDAGIVIASQSRYRLGPLSTGQNALLAITTVDELLSLPMLRSSWVRGRVHNRMRLLMDGGVTAADCLDN